MNIVTLPHDSVGAGLEPWQAYVKSAIRDVRSLCRALQLPPTMAVTADGAHREFQTFVPLPFLQRMQRGNPNDPLLLQVLPRPQEQQTAEGFQLDAVGDHAASRAPGLIQKYRGRALLVLSSVCAVHCRYCFRRHFPYGETPMTSAAWQPALDVLQQDKSIREVILSGGDPLMLVDHRLEQLINQLSAIPHLVRLRIHSRVPIVIPQRVTAGLIDCLQSTRLIAIMVIHANHANEIDQSVHAAIGDLVEAGMPVLNQSVLLRGVNDRLETLVQLSERLIDSRCMPYYLHQLDRVAGAAHFEVPITRGKKLVSQMREHLPGYAVPRYVQEIAGQLGKRVLA